MTDEHNRRRYEDARRGVYEVWFMTWNHPETEQGFWLRYITEVPTEGPARAELWFARFDPHDPARTFGIHKRFVEVASTSTPFSLSIGGSRLASDGATGKLAGGGHEIAWDLHWEPALAELRLLPDVAYRGVGETTVISPNPRVAMSGTLVVDGERLAFAGAILGQSHLWGTRHSYSWTWGRCADFADAPGALFEIYAGRLQRRGVTLPPIALVVLDLDGERYRLNQVRHMIRNRARWSTGHVTFSAWSPTVKIEGELTCAAEQMVLAPYLDPDGTEVFCANTEIGDARLTVYRRAGFGWRELRTIEGKRRAHFELGGRARDPLVTREHVLVE